MKVVRVMETQGINCSPTQRNNPEDQVETTNCYFHTVKNIFISDYFNFFIYCVSFMHDGFCTKERDHKFS
jgi:hypothetical protein